MPFYENKEGANAHAEKLYLLLGKIGREEILPPYNITIHSSLFFKESLDIKSIKQSLSSYMYYISDIKITSLEIVKPRHFYDHPNFIHFTS